MSRHEEQNPELTSSQTALPDQMPHRKSTIHSAAYVVFHAGEIYNRDCVRWYSPFYVGEGERLYREYHNVGDSVVYDSTLKLLDFDQFIEVDFNNPDPETIASIKAVCSHGIVRGSNYFHPNMKWGKLIEFVQAIGLPLIVLGVGVQAPLGEPAMMGPESERVAKALSDLCVSLGVRGERSAQAFSAAGIKNVRIVGCPSMFRSLKPVWEKRQWEPLPEHPTSIVSCGVTLRREIGHDYVRDVRQYLALQRSLVIDAFQNTSLTLFSQGELFEKFYFHGRKDLLAYEQNEPVKQGWMYENDREMCSIYDTSLFYSDDIPTFCRALTDCRVVIGFRVHGVLPAIAMGVPGALIDYDSRTSELIRTFDLPSISLQNCSFGNAYEAAREFNYDRVAYSYAKIKDELITFLVENQVKSRIS